MIGNISKKIALACLLALPFAVFSPIPAQAADQPVDVLKKICDEKPNATVCRDKNPNPGPNDNPLFGSGGVITEIVNIISLLVGIAAVIMIIVAGLKFTTSGSNPQDVTTAREMILYAVAGLIVVSIAQILVRFILVRVIA